MKRKIIYTDAPPEVDEAIDYAVEHNLFLTKQQFLDLLENSKQSANEQVAVPLDSNSLAFFREYARKKRTSYQNVMSGILRNYARKHTAAL